MKWAAMGVGLALTASQAQAIVIDNGIPIGTVGHFSVDVLTGGATESVVFTTQLPSGAVVTENLVSSYRVFVDPGIDGQGFALQGSEPEQFTLNSNPNNVLSTGTFIGANGNTLRWDARSSIRQGTQDLDTLYGFGITTALFGGDEVGPLRVYQYLDAEGPDDGDILRFNTS